MARVVLPNWEPKDPTDDADYWFDWGRPSPSPPTKSTH
jgi:hypothetical protein